MNEFKPKSIQYCNHFQEGKCRFGDKCKYEHKINLDYKKKDMDYDEKKKSNYIIIINFNIRKKFHHNNGNNKNDNVEGKPPKYSNQHKIPIKNMKLNNTNSEDNISCDNNSRVNISRI